jgi:ubiquinone/menaquinone biosynthesis C-methylase UbiE
MKESIYYDFIAPYYDTLVPRDIKGICSSVERIVKRYNQEKEILDLGCGTGRFTIELAKRRYKMHGLDMCDEMLQVARKNAQKKHLKIKFIRGDIRNFTLKKKTHVIWARGSIGDLLTLIDVKRALKNIRKNLLKHGIFIFDVRDYLYHEKLFKKRNHEKRIFKKRNKVLTFSFAQNLNKKTKIATIKTEVTIKSPGDLVRFKVNHALKHYTKKELTKLLDNAGFDICEIMPGYELAKEKKPRILVIAKR